MKRLVTVAAIALSACSPTATAPPSPASSPSPSVSASSSPAPVAVVVDTTARPDRHHTVYIVGLDGKPTASASAADQTPISSWPAASPIASLWSTYATASDTRVYYLDGDNAVRYLGRDGTTGEVARIPGDASTRSFFAVSPDDSQIAVSVIDYSTPPNVHLHFYVQDLRAGTKTSVATATNLYFWPVGWHAGKVVVQVGQPIPQTIYGAYPDAALEFMLVDPATGGAVTVGGAGCLPQPSLATPAGIVCIDPAGTAFRVLGWDGKDVGLSGPPGTGGASLSADGRHVATADSTGVLLSTLGALDVRTNAPFGFPGEAGWIDSSHLVYRLSGSSREAIYDAIAKTTALITVDGKLVARLPGGL